MTWQEELKVKLHQYSIWKNKKEGDCPELVTEETILNIVTSLLKKQIDNEYTGHQQIKDMIDEMIEKERSLSEGDMTYDATDLLTELRDKL